MIFLRLLFNFIFGYLNISIEGFFVERFINTCISKRILLWNVKRKKSTLLFCNISIKDFKKIKSIAKKTNCRIKITSKKGLPFALKRYRKRKVFLFFIIPVIALVIISSNYVWNIEIYGTEKIDRQDIMEELNKEGLSIGKLKSKIDKKRIINNMRLKRDDISWIEIDLKGTNAIVSVVEAKEKPNIIDENEYCNIVSNQKGIITKITAKTGTAVKKVGDIVEEGEILIGGYMEGKYTDLRYVHAFGNIEAKTWKTKRKRMNLKTTITTETGKNENRYTLNINKFKINFYKTLPNFEKYDTINMSKKIRVFSNFYLPIELKKVTYKELKEEPKTYGKKEAQDLLLKDLEEEFEKEEIPKEKIKNKVVNINEIDDNTIEVELTYEVLEQIGIQEKINSN